MARIDELKQLARDARASGNIDVYRRAIDAVEAETVAIKNRQASEAQRISRTGYPAEYFADGAQPTKEDLGIEGGSVVGGLRSTGDALATMGSALGSEVASGLIGLASGIGRIPDGEFYKAGEDVQALKDLMTYTPKTDEGVKILQDFGTTLTNLPAMYELVNAMKWLEEVGEEGGRAAEEMGAPPSISTLIQVAPQALPELLAFAKTPKKVKALLDSSKSAFKSVGSDVAETVTKGVESVSGVAKRRKAKDVITDKILKGDFDAETAGWKLEYKNALEADTPRTVDVSKTELQRIDGQGKPLMLENKSVEATIPDAQPSLSLEAPTLVKNKLESEVIKQGFEKPVVASLKGASPTDKQKIIKMVEIRDKANKNAKFRVKNRASDVVGDSLNERIKVLAENKSQAGKRLDVAAKELQGQKVSVKEAFDEFFNDLNDDLGITFDADDGRIIFERSMLEGDEKSQKIVKVVLDRAKAAARNGGDAYELHKLKRFIDNKVSYKKVGKEGLDADSERIVKKLRANIDRALDKASPSYDEANSAYAELKTVIDDIEGLAGKKIDPSSPNYNKALGTLSRGLLSNNKSRVSLMDSIDDIEGLAKKYGGKFDDDLELQAIWVDELDRLLGAEATTSAQGVVEKGVGKAIEMKTNPIGAVLKGSAEVIDKARGINTESRLKSIRELLEAQ